MRLLLASPFLLAVVLALRLLRSASAMWVVVEEAAFDDYYIAELHGGDAAVEVVIEHSASNLERERPTRACPRGAWQERRVAGAGSMDGSTSASQ